LLHLNPSKAAGTAPPSMVADFLTSHEEDKDSELYQEHEATMMATAATVYIGKHLMPSYCCTLTRRNSLAGAETVRHDNNQSQSHSSTITYS